MRSLLSTTFRSLKPHSSIPKHISTSPKSPSTFVPVLSKSPSKSAVQSKPKSQSRLESESSSSKYRNWSVYLILSTNSPIKTYVGVTTNFSRRLKQHNGELKGGAKASQAGRPWICACIIQGFENKSEACKFETKWKNLSRKISRKKVNQEETEAVDNGSLRLLRHRNAALDKVKGSIDCTNLKIVWKLDPS